ncbi:MAG TPA: permease [bacterium]|jgi:hypothetical protein|nr:permease [bacterium]
MPILIDIAHELAGLAIRVLPYFVLGAATAAALRVYVPSQWTGRLLASGTRSVWLASVLAAVLPGCSCATGPMAEGLHRQGAKLGTVTAFLMMSPLLAPPTVVLTWGILGWQFAIARVVAPFLFIPILGMLLNVFHGRAGWGVPLPVAGGSGHADACGCADPDCTAAPPRPRFLHEFTAVLKTMHRPFLLGVGIAAVLTVVFPEGAIARTIGAAGPFAFLAAALIGIPIYVCEGEEVPLTYAALGLGLASGPAFTFLLGSVGTCIPTVLMARGIIGRRATMLYTAAWFVFAIGAGMLFGFLRG